MRKVNTNLVLLFAIVAMAFLGLILVMATNRRAETYTEKANRPYINLPEEWQAITSDTMKVTLFNDTLHLEFMYPTLDTTGQWDRAMAWLDSVKFTK